MISQVSNALQQLPIDQVLACWSPTKLGPKKLVRIGLATQMESSLLQTYLIIHGKRDQIMSARRCKQMGQAHIGK